MSVEAVQHHRPHITNQQWRSLGSWLFAMALFALVTGPAGSRDNPYDGFKGSWLSGRLLVFLGIGVVIWAFTIWFAPRRDAVRTAMAPVTQARRRWLGNRWVSLGLALLALAIAILLPLRLSGFWQEVLVSQMGIFVLLALGLNVVVGFAGLLDLGYVAFYAIGAYSAAYWTGAMPVKPPFTLNIWLTFPFAIVACIIAGVVLGFPTLRLRGDYLAIVTLGFGEIVRIVATNADSITNGPRGVVGIPHFSLFGHSFGIKQLPYYYLILTVIVIVILLFRRLENSRIGRSWTAIREDEPAAEASGIPLVKYKIMAFAIGASTSGLAGVIYAGKIGYINPANFTLNISILVLACVIFGGMGSIVGVVVGAALLQWLPNFLRGYVPSSDRVIYFGALLVVMMIFRPQGLIPSRRRAREIAIFEEEREMTGATVS